MTDWKTLAAARCPDIPEDAVDRTVPSLVALEAAFRSLAEELTAVDEPAVIFANVKERGE